MFNIILLEPEIPPNTGNIIRLCANTGCQLHLIHPLGFSLNDKQMKRAGLDYHESHLIKEYENRENCFNQFSSSRIFAIETCGTKQYDEMSFKPNDAFLFGKETKGLPTSLLKQFPEKNILRIPMIPNNRSLNLSNSVALVIYEAWRQNSFTTKPLNL